MNRQAAADEAWFFINGIATSRSGMKLALRRLEQLFQRPITGILNRTLGPFVDLLECILQRDARYSTRDVREGYDVIRTALLDPAKARVILLSHSQGGIIASLIVDRLLAELGGVYMQKLEVYTFACAANHFANPQRGSTASIGGGSSATPAASALVSASAGSSSGILRTLRHVEHFANGRDPVSQIGVLAFATPAQKLAVASRGATTSSAGRRMSKGAGASDGKGAKDTARQGLLFAPLNGASEQDDVFRGASSTSADGCGDPELPRVASAPNQPYHGQLFVRWQASGHLLSAH